MRYFCLMTSKRPVFLANYQQLINSLPYLEQAFITKRTTWNREYEQSNVFRDFCDQRFQSQSSIKLSRADVFEATSQSFSDGLFTTILWGYPRNMRGSTFHGILEGLKQIQSALPEEKGLSKDRFLSICKELNGTGIGLSTLTKMLYFFRYKVEGLPCLIFDRRIIEVCNEQAFSELLGLVQITDFNKCNKYHQFLEIIHNIAKANRYKPDQLELFLFQFGNSLKPVNVSATTV